MAQEEAEAAISLGPLRHPLDLFSTLSLNGLRVGGFLAPFPTLLAGVSATTTRVSTATVGGGSATAGVGTAAAGVGIVTAGVGIATAGVGIATAGVGIATVSIGVTTAGVGTATVNGGTATASVDAAAVGVGVGAAGAGTSQPAEVGIAVECSAVAYNESKGWAGKGHRGRYHRRYRQRQKSTLHAQPPLSCSPCFSLWGCVFCLQRTE